MKKGQVKVPNPSISQNILTLPLQKEDRNLLMNYLSRIETKDPLLKEEVINTQDLWTIVKLAEAAPVFAKFCKTLNWQARILREFRFSHDRINSFDLLRGEIFFGMALDAAEKEDKTDFMPYLKKAVAYSSIHAIQRYHEYLYQYINASKTTRDNMADKLSWLTEIKKNCVRMIECYGSYAYMMLAEVCFQFAECYHETAETQRSEETYQAALNACDFAEKHLKESQPSIFQASYGEGLGFSNRFGIATPAAFKERINEWKAGVVNRVGQISPLDMFSSSESTPVRGRTTPTGNVSAHSSFTTPDDKADTSPPPTTTTRTP